MACNLSKDSLETPEPLSVLLDPEVTVSEDGAIHAKTPQARKLIDLLGLDRPRLREFQELTLLALDLPAETANGWEPVRCPASGFGSRNDKS